jgi:hypothetical protein
MVEKPQADAIPAGQVPFPHPVNWAAFVDALRKAREVHLEDRLLGVGLAVAAVIELLGKHRSIHGEGLPEPFSDLAHGLIDLGQGRQSDLLTPLARNTTKPGKGFADELVMAYAAMAVDELMKAGETRPAAGAKVARTIKAAKLPVTPRRGANLTSTVLGWRERLSEGNENISQHAHELWREPRERLGDTPALRAEHLLRALRDLRQMRFR